MSDDHMTANIKTVARRAEAWLSDRALPLWSSRGFDAEAGLFEEQLTFAGDPVTSVPRRLMVQSRQISVFAAASMSGRFAAGRDLALGAMRRTIEAYHEADGRPGWVFSIDLAGRPVDAKRDLYAHAFVLFALAWAMRLERVPAFENAVEATLAFIDGDFAEPGHGGFWECLPRPDARRRQNPHMHLFEAFIALYETTRRRDVLDRCHQLRELAVGKFMNLETGALRELFFDDWRVHPMLGEGSVEPGHLFEWAWLLRCYEAISGLDQSLPVSRLLDLAIRRGLDRSSGRIIDEIGEDGHVRRASSRSWPHAEALKALSTEAIKQTFSDDLLLIAILNRLCTVYIPDDLDGLWIDHVDSTDAPLPLNVPASSLYHIYFGITSVTSIYAT